MLQMGENVDSSNKELPNVASPIRLGSVKLG